MKIGSITFPFTEVFRCCLESIRERFTRTLITAISILFGIAFYVTIRSMNTIAALLSVAAAAYPAFYASRLHPAEALRYEV